MNNCDNQLDLVFSNNPLINVIATENNIVPLDPYHPPLVSECTINDTIKHSCSNQLYYDFVKANYYDMNIILAKFDWSNLYKIKDVNIALDLFYDILLNTIEKTVPKKQTYTHTFPPWFSSELRMLIHEKKRCINHLNQLV